MSHIPSRSGYPSTTATARVTENLALYGHTPHVDEPEYRPFPEPDAMNGMVEGLFACVAAHLADTALHADVNDLLWSLADLLHRKADRVQRFLDENEDRQRISQKEQDGSEIRSVELERLIEKGRVLIEKRAAFEHMRDEAARHYEEHTGGAWRPRSGSMVNRKVMTAAMIDSRDHINAKRRRETEVLLPDGPKIAFAGGLDFNDHKRIWETLDDILSRHPGMVLLHGGNERGAEKIASCWAASRKVACIVFKPDWNRDAKAAPFKRNDRMLETMPVGLVVFPGNGITDNLADKAKRMGIRVRDCRR
ncbi:MAG: DUF2493 domain-containing protein [Hyphomicrobiaceae bacterium]